MSDIQLTVIGSGDAFNSGGRNHTCFFFKSAFGGFLIDCGATAPASLKQQDVKNDDVDVIFISHFHGDHYGGLPFFLLDSAVSKRKKRLTIVSPPGLKDRLEKLLALLYPGSNVLGKLNILFKNFPEKEMSVVDNISLTTMPVIHSPATQPHGLRIKVGSKIISYSGDTEWTPKLIKLAKDADLFICECNFYNLSFKGHLNYKTLSNNLKNFTFKRILLTHFDTEMLKNLDKVELECAYDGLITTI